MGQDYDGYPCHGPGGADYDGYPAYDPANPEKKPDKDNGAAQPSDGMYLECVRLPRHRRNRPLD